MAAPRYRVSLLPTVRRDLLRLPLATQRRLATTIDALASEPRPPGSKLLTGKPTERIWRVRQGDYRILYEIRNQELLVLVIRIGHRRDIYRGL